MHGDYFETMFDMSCFIWFQLYSESQRTECINNLIDYIIRVCKLKFTSTVSCINNHFKTCYILCIFSVAVVAISKITNWLPLFNREIMIFLKTLHK